MAATQPHFQNLRFANVNELVILFRSLNCVAFPNSAVNRTRSAHWSKEDKLTNLTDRRPCSLSTVENGEYLTEMAQRRLAGSSKIPKI
jgi:hypothetical protein